MHLSRFRSSNGRPFVRFGAPLVVQAACVDASNVAVSTLRFKDISRFWLRFLRDVSIGRKVLIVAAASAVVGAIVPGAVLFALQIANLRQQFQYQVETVAELMASYASATVAFGDSEAAREVLARLQTNSAFEAASLLLLDDTVFATYGDATWSHAEVAKAGRFDGFRKPGSGISGRPLPCSPRKTATQGTSSGMIRGGGRYLDSSSSWPIISTRPM
ncbi:MAG TPA: CHASE sensor domain-containing protein [Opitutaceae bacterium]